MARKGNGITQQTTQAEPGGEQLPEQQSGAPQESAEEATAGAVAAPEQTQGELGPEDFDQHTSARLIDDHARDLVLLEDVTRRLKNRAPVIARRAMDAAAKRGERNPVVEIAGRRFFPRARPARDGGGVGLSEERATRAVVALE